MPMNSSTPRPSASVCTMTYCAEPFEYDCVALAIIMMPYTEQIRLIISKNRSARFKKSRTSGRNFFKRFHLDFR